MRREGDAIGVAIVRQSDSMGSEESGTADAGSDTRGQTETGLSLIRVLEILHALHEDRSQ
jgi:hypothetical protein